jgi:hypothetical protein
LSGFGWEDLEGEREQPPLLEMREEVREEASSGLGGNPKPKVRRHPQWRGRHLCLATTSGDALTGQGPLILRGSHCRATGSGVAPPSASPP